MKKHRIMALLIAAVLFTCLLPSDAFAAQLRICDNEDYPEHYSFNTGVANLPASFASHDTSNFNLYYLRGSYDTAVYCIQINSPRISADDEYSTSTSPQSANLSAEQKILLSAALCMGHTGGWDNRPKQVATQIVVWMITTGAYANEAQRDAILGGYIGNADVKAYANQIWNDCVSYYTIPSFTVHSWESDIPKYDLIYDAERGVYYTELTDANDVIGRFSVTSLPEGYSYSIEDNVLTIYSDTPYMEDFEMELLNSTTQYQNRAYLMYMYHAGNQEMAYSVRKQSDPVAGYLRLNAIYSSAAIIKQSEDDLVAGLKFKITKSDDTSFEPIILETDETGRTQEAVVGLGTYRVEEIDTPARYIQPEPQTFTINVIGEKVVLTFENKCRDLTLAKTSEDGIVEGLEFRVTCEELGFEKNIMTDSEGKWRISGLEPGIYTIEEINTPDQYVPMEPVTVEVTFDTETYAVTADNVLKRGNVEVDKKCARFGGPLSNARYGIYTEAGELVQEIITDSKGKAVSGELTYGSYYIKEIETPFGYFLDDGKYPFTIKEQGQYEIMTTTDDPKIGRVRIIYNGEGGNVDTGSAFGYMLPLGLAAVWLALIVLIIAVRKQVSAARR